MTTEQKAYTKIYRGQLCHTSNGEEDELLGLLLEEAPHKWKVKILAEMVSDDKQYDCDFLSVRYYTSDVAVPADKVVEVFLRSLYGDSEIEYGMAYSDLTGYLWTDEKLVVGGHDLIAELTTNLGKFLHMEILFADSVPVNLR
jgi:hypothetical protein